MQVAAEDVVLEERPGEMPGFFFLSWSLTACRAGMRLWGARRKLTLRREGEQAGCGMKGEAGKRRIPFVGGRACRARIRL